MDILSGLYVVLSYCLIKEYVVAYNKVIIMNYLVFRISNWKCSMAYGSDYGWYSWKGRKIENKNE